MKICMLGAGAMGCGIGGMLAAGGQDVTFVDTWQEHVEALRRNGLTLCLGDEEKIIPVKAQEDCAGLGEMDLIIVFVKSFATREAIASAKSCIGPRTMVLSLQNGLGNEEEMLEVIDQRHLVCGRTYAGGSVLAPGKVAANVRGKEMYIGEMSGERSERISAVAAIMNEAGLSCHVSDNIRGLMWDKLLINVATGALTGITRLPYGPLYQVPEIHDCAIAAVKEGMATAKALGVVLSSDDPEDSWRKANSNLPYDFKPSMLQGVEAGKRSEIRFINGAVVRFGKKAGVATPVNQTLVACMIGIERWLEEFFNVERNRRQNT